MKFGRKGFTLVELIIVIIIIGILAAIAAPLMTANIDRARRAEAISVLGSIRTAARLYYAETTTWPAVIGDINAYMQATDRVGPYVSSGGVYALSATTASATGGKGGGVNMTLTNGYIDNP